MQHSKSLRVGCLPKRYPEQDARTRKVAMLVGWQRAGLIVLTVFLFFFRYVGACVCVSSALVSFGIPCSQVSVNPSGVNRPGQLGYTYWYCKGSSLV